MIVAGRSEALVAAVLSVVHVGRPFAVVDQEYPSDRIKLQYEQIRPALVLVLGELSDHVREIFPAQILDTLLVLDERRADAGHLSEAPHPLGAPVAYLLFTSGTTGVPKCIQTGPAPLRHFIDFYLRTFRPTPEDRFSMISGLGHDPLLRDIFVPLACGARICVPPDDCLRAPPALWAWLRQSAVTVMHATPQHLRLVDAGREKNEHLTHLRYFFSGGDMLTASHVTRLRELAPAVEVVNFYGSSETPQAMAFHRVGDLTIDDPIPLGKGISDVELLVLAEDLSVMPVGQVGQIGIRTRFLSSGYLGDTENTQARFLLAPGAKDTSDRIYLSGDLGAYRADGAVIAQGRLDDQVKVRGYRIELAEVTRQILDSGLCGNGAVIAHTTGDGEKQLIAFVTPPSGMAGGNTSRGADAELVSSLRQRLSSRLPSYMVPARWFVVPTIPLTGNGKIDRRALASIFESARQVGDASVRDDISLDPRFRRVIVEIENALECTITSLDCSFVDLGGDSLSYIRVSMVLEQVLGSLPSNWEKRPLEELANSLPVDSAPPVRRFAWVRIELALLLRCVSIIFVVTNHATQGLIFAATSTLFVVSGINFNRFLAPAIIQTGRLSALGRFVLRFAVPAAIWQLLRAVFLRNFWLPNFLLLGTLYQNPMRPMYTFWYLDVLAANLFILGLIILATRDWLSGSSDAGALHSRQYLLAATVTATGLVLGLVQISTGFWDGELGLESVSPIKWIWMISLGMMIDLSTNILRRWVSTGVIVALTAAFYLGQTPVRLLSGLFDGFLTFTVLGLIWAPYIRIPRFLYWPVMAVASSTLFIYITNYSFLYHLFPRLGVPKNILLQTLLAVILGYLVTKLWDFAVQWVNGLAQKVRASRGRARSLKAAQPQI